MTLLRNTFLLLVLASISNCASPVNLSQTPIGLINNVAYNNAEYSNSNASNGFLVRHKKQTYAVTAKHILLIAKTPNMQVVDFEGELKEWQMHPKEDSSKVVILDQLLNPNRTDSLSWEFLDTNWDTYNDWLVFSIKENNSDHTPLKFREEPLIKGEKLFVVGWSYSDKSGAQRVYEYEFNKTDGDYHEIVQIKGPESLGGLSGSPVVDENARLVGLVSSGWEDETSGQIIIAATSVKNIATFISSL